MKRSITTLSISILATACAQPGPAAVAPISDEQRAAVTPRAPQPSDGRVRAAANPVDRAALALRWAPIHYQDVATTGSTGLGGAADYITGYDFDGDLVGTNNWDHAAQYSLAAKAYYSVVETASHWFIVYVFFHPRDWADSVFATEHENDSEGLLVTIARDGSEYGVLRAAVTVAHRDFYSYVPLGSDWTSRAESVDGILALESAAGELHPVTAQEAEGHGLKARPYYDIHGDGVVYYPSLTTSEEPAGPDDRHVRYRLVDIFEPGGLWAQRANPSLFVRHGFFAGDRSRDCGRTAIWCTRNSAHAPWGWDDGDDALKRGALATDPAGLVANYFTISEPLSTTYTWNPYRE